MKRFIPLVVSLAASLLLSAAAEARSIVLGRTETRTDYVSTGVGGIGNGPGNLVVSGVSGGVRKAFLYWHGINNIGIGAVYDNDTVSFAGHSITGASLGDAETNCWGNGSSRAFFADVTPYVTGNGSYTIDGLDAAAGHNGNGASLIVLFNDGNPDNDRDLVFFEGNDSDYVAGTFPDDANGWSASLNGINYTGGSVHAQLHVGDGQAFTDDWIYFSSGQASLPVQDTTSLWDGLSVTNAGYSRAGNDGLWDIHTFDITSILGNAGVKDISLSGMTATGDCHSLVTLMLDLGGGSAPCGNGTLEEGEECDPAAPAGPVSPQCPGLQTCVNDCTCGCTSDAQCNDGNGCTQDSCNVETGACEYSAACASGPGCEDTCDEEASACRLCGRPVGNRHCIVNAIVVLQAALGLRDCDLCLCDTDSSGTITTTDALRVLRTCVNLPTDLQCSVPESTTTTTTVTVTSSTIGI